MNDYNNNNQLTDSIVEIEDRTTACRATIDFSTDTNRIKYKQELEEHNKVDVFKDVPETSHKLDAKYNHLLKYLNIKNVYDVPIRKNMFSGTGKAFRCHWNVALLAEKYGGHVVMGYHLYADKQDVKDELTNRVESFTVLNADGHSCWQTPEGKLVDVTYGVQEEWMKSFNLDNTFCRFAPLVKFDPKKEDIENCWDFAVKRNYLKSGIKMMSSGKLYVQQRNLKEGVFVRDNFKKNTFANSDFLKAVKKVKPWQDQYYKIKFPFHFGNATFENHFDCSQRRVA